MVLLLARRLRTLLGAMWPRSSTRGQIASRFKTEGRNGRSLRGRRMVFGPSRRKGSTGRSGDLICNDGFAIGIVDEKCDGNQR